MTEKQKAEPEEIDAVEAPSVFLTNFTYPHQIHVPWSSTPTSGFQVGAGGVGAIEVTSSGVVVTAQKATDVFELWFTAGGYGWRKLELPEGEK